MLSPGTEPEVPEEKVKIAQLVPAERRDGGGLVQAESVANRPVPYVSPLLRESVSVDGAKSETHQVLESCRTGMCIECGSRYDNVVL